MNIHISRRNYRISQELEISPIFHTFFTKNYTYFVPTIPTAVREIVHLLITN